MGGSKLWGTSLPICALRCHRGHVQYCRNTFHYVQWCLFPGKCRISALVVSKPIYLSRIFELLRLSLYPTLVSSWVRVGIYCVSRQSLILRKRNRRKLLHHRPSQYTLWENSQLCKGCTVLAKYKMQFVTGSLPLLILCLKLMRRESPRILHICLFVFNVQP